MRTLAIVRQDSAIYWKKIGVDTEGEAIFDTPVIIKCRWDIVNADLQSDDVIETETYSNALYPDRVLVVGSYVHFGGQDVLDSFTDEQKADPRKCPQAHRIKDQSTIYELRWRQYVTTDTQHEHLVIECHV